MNLLFPWLYAICLSIASASIHPSLRMKDAAVATPVIMAESILSTEDDEFGGTLSPDGKLFFFCKRAPTTGRSNYIAICFVENKNGSWANVQVAPFSGQYRDFNPQFSADGSKLYFMSTRPVTTGVAKNDSDIWFVERKTNGWSEPVHLGEAVNSPYVEYACSFANTGDMYLSSGRNGRDVRMYVSRLTNGEYQAPEELSEVVNTVLPALDACIAPDESYLLFTSAGNDDMIVPKQGVIYPRSDLYICYKIQGTWSKPTILPEPLNSVADDGSPAVSRDGKTLFFTSKRNFASIPMAKKLNHQELEKQLHGTLNGLGNIYAVSTDGLKTKGQ
ncbi:PD40 domain-containing protein [Chryseolinea soli]|uniref:Exo-alpha-sialidase n=1 Tax=Chryseolinea soli TaxID=2321403 RepID=A0A385SN26_9BACT|nr:PD40 domain-containing protein [Chryseolinea soli]AYB31896.1 hypothetical protein D4L85_15575 [Chryseolinea soli]